MKKRLFVIIAHYPGEVFDQKKQIIEEVAKSYGVIALFAPKNAEYEFDIHQSYKMLRGSDFYIADLTFERPSCYYEVGFVQALRKPLYLIVKDGEQVYQIRNKQDIVVYTSIEEYKTCITKFVSEFVCKENHLNYRYVDV